MQARRPQRLRLPVDQPCQSRALAAPVETYRARGPHRRCALRYPRCSHEMRSRGRRDRRVLDPQRTKHEAMAQLSAVGVPAGAVLDTQELIDEPSFWQRGILQTMTHGERKMTMPTWPVRFDGVPSEVKSAPLLGEHTDEVLADWLSLDAAAVARLRQDGIV